MFWYIFYMILVLALAFLAFFSEYRIPHKPKREVEDVFFTRLAIEHKLSISVSDQRILDSLQPGVTATAYKQWKDCKRTDDEGFSAMMEAPVPLVQDIDYNEIEKLEQKHALEALEAEVFEPIEDMIARIDKELEKK